MLSQNVREPRGAGGQAPKYGSVYLRKIPHEWIELLRKEAEKEGVSIPHYIKAYILRPWVMQRLQQRGG